MLVNNYDIRQFIAHIAGKKIIAFCMGLELHNFINMYDEEYNVSEKLKYIVDNDKLQWTEDAIIRSKRYAVRSPESLKSEDPNDSVIVIFNQNFQDILDQLFSYFENIDIECFVFPLMQTFTRMEKAETPIPKQKEVIPRKIHYCWFGKNELPKEAGICIASWKEFCPDYEIKQWNEDNFDTECCKYVSEAYRNKAYAFVSDYARLKILYDEGGIYLDTDVEMLKNWDRFLRHNMFCGFSCHVPRIATGLGFGSVSGHPLLYEMLDAYKYESYEMDYGFNKTLCQMYNTKVLVTHGLKQNGKTQMVDDVCCYSKDYFDPMSSCYGIAPNIEYAYSVHKSANSWVSENNIRFKNHKLASKEGVRKLLKMIDETKTLLSQDNNSPVSRRND